MDAQALAALYDRGFYDPKARRFRSGIVEGLMRRFRVWRAWKLHRQLGGYPGRILDVGCGRGFTLAALQELGHDVYGTQISPEAAAYAREQLGLTRIETRDLMDVGYPENWFDAVTAYHVIEHLADPHAFLLEIRRILRPGGLLILEVPNAEGWGSRWTGRHWLGWDVPYHRFHFSGRTLVLATEGLGFQEAIWSFPWLEYGPAVIIQSLLNKISGTENRLFRTLSFTAERADALTGLPLLLHGLGALVLALPATLLACIGASLGQGEIIAVRCRKGI
jgi:SAM-dependent methyltransferase